MMGGEGLTGSRLTGFDVPHTEAVVQTSTTVEYPDNVDDTSDNLSWINITRGTSGTGVPTVAKGDKLVFKWTEKGVAAQDYVIAISPEKFPGTYTLSGYTVRRDRDGVDKPFNFVIPRAKFASNVTITLEAKMPLASLNSEDCWDAFRAA